YVRPEDYEVLGRMTVDVYAGLPDMPGPEIQPDYYAMLADVRARATGPGTEILVAVSDIATLLGGVTFVRDMSAYNSGGNASTYTEHAGIRLLVVSPDARRQGVGKALTQSCIRRAKDLGRKGVVLHTTRAMAVA
ncbi:MAG: GNAT family N-acetyltransferase, partial [Desulfobacterales bacterium]|nr:GNAT family N-acetyltransferase [Desulfobacterales bacterium]